MVPSLNSMFGQDLCSNLAVGEVQIVLLSSMLATTENAVGVSSLFVLSKC